MIRNLGEMREENIGTELGTLLDDAERKYTRATGKHDFRTGFEFKSPGEMGDAIGQFNTRTGKKSLRPDVVRDVETLVHTTVHETIHEKGMDGNGLACGEGHCLFDGFVELAVDRKLGYKAVSAYEGITRAAGLVVAELGDRAFSLASHGVESEMLLTRALFDARREKGAAHDDVEKVWENAHRAVLATMAA